METTATTTDHLLAAATADAALVRVNSHLPNGFRPVAAYLHTRQPGLWLVTVERDSDAADGLADVAHELANHGITGCGSSLAGSIKAGRAREQPLANLPRTVVGSWHTTTREPQPMPEYTRKDTALADLRRFATTSPEQRTPMHKERFRMAKGILTGEYGWTAHDVQVAYTKAVLGL